MSDLTKPDSDQIKRSVRAELNETIFKLGELREQTYPTGDNRLLALINAAIADVGDLASDSVFWTIRDEDDDE